MNELKSLYGTSADRTANGCYAELMALRYFRRAVKDYACKSISTDIFGPLVRNIMDESCVHGFRDRLCEKMAAEADDGFAESLKNIESSRKVLAMIWRRPQLRETCRSQVLEWADAIIAEYERISEDDPLPARLSEMRALMKLTEVETEVLSVLWLISVEKLEVAQVPFAMGRLSGFIALCTGIGEQAVRKAMMARSRLCRYGCLDSENRGQIHAKVRCYLDGINDEPLASSFYTRDDSETLPVDFFGKIADEHLPLLRRLLTGERGRKVNILLYGAPGTGKSSFARALARETGRIAYQVRQRPKDRDGDFREARPEVRYAAVEICDEQTDSDTSLMIVDEADALLRCSRFSPFGEDVPTGDKGLLNDVLERIETPTVWIANTRADELDSSSRRRFDYAIMFEPLSREQRLVTWHNAARKAGADVLFSDGDLERCSKEYAVSTGIAAKAFGNIVKAGASREEALPMLERLLSQQVELSGSGQVGECVLEPAKDYSLEGLNVVTSIPLEKIERSVVRFLDDGIRKNDKDAPRMNLLLTGAPGSGKSEFVKYLAKSVGRPLLMRRASDLKSKWVGETEQRIAAAFSEARAKKAILFLDEIDTFLDNREALPQGHEKSMVNEVLQQMESFGGVFVGTTNFPQALDPAVARRFTFKIELAPLDSAGRRIFWRRFFGNEPSETAVAQLDALQGLTPGDFRTVRQGLYYLGDEAGEEDRLAALKAELSAKAGGQRRIGF